jgi:hypothetical protein
MQARPAKARHSYVEHSTQTHLGSSHSQQRIDISFLKLPLLTSLPLLAIAPLSLALAAIRVTQRIAGSSLWLPLLRCCTSSTLLQLLCWLSGLRELHQLLNIPGHPGWCTQGIEQL